MPESLLPAGTPPIGPLGLVGNVPVPNIETRPEEQYFQDVNTPTGLKPITPGAGAPAPVDPFAGFKDAGFDQFQNAPSAPDAFSHFKTADDLDVRSTDELNADRKGFDPVAYFSSNPDAANNPAKLQKLLDVYRKRREEGLTAGGVISAAVKETPGLVGNILGGVKRLGERAIDVGIQPVSNIVLGALTGDLFDEQKRDALFNETRKVIKKGTAEAAAGSESATVGLVDLSRQGVRKLDTAYTPVPLSAMGDFSTQESIPLKKPLTDQELLAQISDDASFRQNAEDILKGGGEAAKNFGLDKETLGKQGISLDEEAIKQLSLVDPITMVAAGGAFKLVGTAGKVLGTAQTLAGAKYLTEKLADIAKFSAGKVVQGTGKALGGTGNLLRGTGTSAATIAGVSSAVTGGGIPTSLIIGGGVKLAGKTARAVGPLLEHAGKAIAGEVPVSAALQKVLDYSVKPASAAAGTVIKGAATGIAAAAPFAVAADSDEQAGALLGAGAAIGAAHGAGAGSFRVVKNAAAREYFGQNRPVLPDVPSPGYGQDAALDAAHAENIQKFSAQDASELNNFREILRPQGGEIYSVDRATWRKEMERVFPEASPELLDIYEGHNAFFDEAKGPDRKVVYLNADATGLHHDAGHIFDALLSEETRKKLDTAVVDTFGQDAINKFKTEYEAKVGNEISPYAALREFAAEQFSALFNNVPVTELNAPKSLLKKFVDVAAEAAETLGIDIGAGVTTPKLGAPISVGIRKLFQNAAGEVTRRNVEGGGQPTTNVTPLPPPETPPTSPIPVDFGGAPTPTPPPARNIRAEASKIAEFKQTPKTPEARAAAAVRYAETGIEFARAEAKKAEGSPTSKVIEKISDSMESGNPVVNIEHLGITSVSTPEAALGKGERTVERVKGYEALNAAQLDVRQNAPAEIVSRHSKNFVPVRWESSKTGKPVLIAMSLDKIISNMIKIADAAKEPGAKELIPYATEGGKFTSDGWREVVADAQAYAENQANGRKGDGGRLEVPEVGLSIPPENPSYTPRPLSPERANFQNLIMGLAPPETGRATKGKFSGNFKAQVFAEANKRPLELPVNIPVKQQGGKQVLIGHEPRVIQEVNPLRNRMKEAGVDTSILNEVTEKIRAQDIVSAAPKPDLNYKAPVTDVIRGGFLPYYPKSELDAHINALANGKESTFEVPKSVNFIGQYDSAGKLLGVVESFFRTPQDAEATLKTITPPAGTSFKTVSWSLDQYKKETRAGAELPAESGSTDPQKNNQREIKRNDEAISEVKSQLAESIKTGPLDFNTFMSAFRDKYFSEWQDHPSFSEMTNKFPDANLTEQYQALREEFNGYFKWDNEQISEKFKEAAGDPSKELEAARYAQRQWQDTSEHLDSRLYELLQSEGRLIRPPAPAPGVGLTQKSLEAVDWSEIRRTLQEMDPKEIQSSFNADIHRVEDLIEGLTLRPEKSPNSVPKQDQLAFETLLKMGREQLVERGQSPGMFLPAPTEFRSKSLQGRTVEEFSDYVLNASPAEFKAATENMTGGLTGGAWNFGLGLKNAADVGVLKSFQEQLSSAAKTAMQSGDFDAAYSAVSKGQFFREAYEAATGTGSAGAAFKRGTAGMESAKPPFPIESTTTGTTSGTTGDATRFQPAEQLDTVPTPTEPDLRIVPTPAAAGGTPPIEPPAGTVIPPPVAAGAFQPAEQLNPDQTPELKVVPAAAGGTPPVLPPGRGLIPPPVAAKEDKESPKFLPEPSKEIQDLAKKYADDTGIPYAPTTGYAEIKPDLSKRLAEFYDKAKSDPTNPEVAKSYAALIKETEDQGKAILAAGYKIEPWMGKGEPYKNSADAIADVRDNKHLYFRKTSDSFGAGESNVGNPMLAESNLVPGQTVNDVFRWVHDFFGHSKEGFQFGPRGEFNAWRAHSEMYSPEAQGALAGETLAQNSWVNYGPHLEGLDVPLKDRPFAEQKNVVVPKELIAEAGAFQPRTEAGRKLEEKGYEIVASGEMGIRSVTILDKDKTAIAQIRSVQLSPKKAEIAFVSKKAGAPAGLEEVLYREVGAQLRDDGVKSLGGHVIAPEPLAIRKKIFGGFKKLTINGEPATYEQALRSTEQPEGERSRYIAAVEPVNEITAATKFQPRVKRDAQGRPLDNEGNIDYPRWQAEGLAANRKREAEPIAKSVPKGRVSVDLGTATGWVLPNKEFVPLDAAFHEQYLANNAADLNKRFKTNFSDTPSVDDRLDALNSGFVRLRNQGGAMRVEANSERWASLKSTVLDTLRDREGKIDGLTVSLLNRKGQQVDSASAPRLQELSGPEKMNAIEEAVNSLRSVGSFQPADGGLPGIGIQTKEEAGRAKAARRITTVKKNNPEAVTPQYARDDSGEIIVTPDGTPKPLTLDYDFINSPLAKEAAKGLKGVKREEAAAVALGDELAKVYREVEKNPDIKAGAKWYSTARTRLRKVFGDDAKFFAELLGATSARTPVEINYRFALDAYNQFKSGAYDKTLAKYREGKQAWDTQDLGDFPGGEDSTRGQFLDWWVNEHDLGVTQSNGKKFGMNSRAVLRVLDGSWASEVQGPKTPNFAGNLTGQTFEATIDVWAGRTLNRLANEGRKDRWRILPENETGISDTDFYLGQAAYRAAAKKLGIKPDALQAVLWFAEKNHWEQKGWTRGAGAAKSDFNVLLAETERAPSGELRMKTPQTGFDFGAEVSDIKKKR